MTLNFGIMSVNHGTPRSGHDAVSWPTIFWALVPLAMISMTQPTGSIAANLTSEQSLHLRVSPIVCLLDCLHTMIQFVFSVMVTGNHQLAATMVISAKVSSEDKTPTWLRTFKESLIFRGVLLLLGVLPETIKIFACSGIPWVKIAMSIYPVSFLILESLAFLGQPSVHPMAIPSVWDPQMQRLRSISNRLSRGYICSASACAWSIFSLTPAIPFLYDANSYAKTCLLATLSGMLSAWLREHVSQLFQWLLWSLSTITVNALISYLCIPLNKFTLNEDEDDMLLRDLPLLPIAVILILNGPVYLIWCEVFLRSLRRTDRTMSLAFLLLHIITVYFWLTSTHDSVGTRKPAWMKFLTVE